MRKESAGFATRSPPAKATNKAWRIVTFASYEREKVLPLSCWLLQTLPPACCGDVTIITPAALE